MADRLQGKKTLNVSGFLDEFEKDDVKKDVDIVELFSHFNIQLNKKGKNHVGLCPWHKDTSPSLSVDQVKGLYNCFGCGESGDIFTLVEKMKGYSFKESLHFLKNFKRTSSPIADKPGMRPGGQNKQIAINETGTGNNEQVPKDINEVKDKDETQGKTGQDEAVFSYDKKAEDKREADSEKSNVDKDNEKEAVEETKTGQSNLLNIITDYYYKKLIENKPALNYLKTRGIKTHSLIKRFKIGFCDGTILNKISDTDKKKLFSLGIFNKNNNEHFLNCITFPLLGDNKNTVGIYGRSIIAESKFPHLYLKGNHKGIFNFKASKVYDSIILTESIIDALSLIECGFENTQALYGTNGLTDLHLKKLKDDRVKEIIIAFDNDIAGKDAALKLKDKLIKEDLSVKIIFPNGKDWNEDLIKNIGSIPKLKVNILNKISEAETFVNPYKKTKLSVNKESGAYIFNLNDVTYRVSGVKDIFVNNLRVNIKASIEDEKFYDNLDLYSARSRTNYSLSLSKIFNTEPNQVEKDLISILEYLEIMRDKNLNPLEEKEKQQLTAEEKELGLKFLRSENMFRDIVNDMELIGYVGEDINKQLLYAAASSRKTDDPISVLIISQSCSGKSYLVDTVKKLLPEEDVIEATSLSDQALNYIGDLKHKFIDLSEAVHNEIIEHQLREMLSAKQLSRIVATKNEKTGKTETTHIKTKAIVSSVMSTTNYNVNPENASRCFVIDTDESKAQTRRIHETQRLKHSLERIKIKNEIAPQIIRKHKAAQKLLQKRTVVNEFARYVDFPDTLMRTRRDHDRFMDLIAVICFMRQYQKEIKLQDALEFIECDLKDYEIAYNIMVNGVLSSSLLEIPKGALEFYEDIRKIIRKLAKEKDLKSNEISVTQRILREATGCGHSWIKQQLKLLVEYEYLKKAGGAYRGSRAFYTLKKDEAVNNLNLTMIPTVAEIKEKLKNKSG